MSKPKTLIRMLQTHLKYGNEFLYRFKGTIAVVETTVSAGYEWSKASTQSTTTTTTDTKSISGTL